jgi:hypothetical protein
VRDLCIALRDAFFPSPEGDLCVTALEELEWSNQSVCEVLDDRGVGSVGFHQPLEMLRPVRWGHAALRISARRRLIAMHSNAS